MGRQIRKVAPWLGMFESHMHSNHTIHRLYRWTTYHSHPTMRQGQPFKGRSWGRPTPGVLLTPDALKFKIPLPLAFVAANSLYNPREQNVQSNGNNHHEQATQLASSGNFKIEQNCQKTVNNYNKCIKNASADDCSYYLNYLNNNCKLTQ